MTLDDRDYYRTLSDKQLIIHHDEFGPSAELAVVLAERLAEATRRIEFDYV